MSPCDMFHVVVTLLQTVAFLITALGVVLAWRQLAATREQARVDFEDTLAREYRNIAQALPVRAFFVNEPLSESEYAAALDDFFHYFDLSNEQVSLRMNDRVGTKAWADWCDGMRTNLSRPSFQRAWEEIKLKVPESFQELRRLEEGGFREDPRTWSR
jgi:hypothetical protein